MHNGSTGETVTTFEVRRDDWRTCRTSSQPLPELADGQVLLRVDRFALTANNVTYALTGDMLGYWKFFPADEGWGRIPVMGFADVAASRHADVTTGERVFGFFPMATHLVIDAGQVGKTQILDTAPHRRDTALAYRQYTKASTDPLYAPEHEDVLLLFRGLFITSFLVDDFLADNGDFGARCVVVSSASSKTAIALAHLLTQRRACRVVGLTSAGNAAFVEGLGCYDEVLTYDRIASLDPGTPTVFVDHSGDGKVVGPLHRHLGDGLKHSAVVGATHWSGDRPDRDLPGPTPVFFFAPTQLEKRQADWGPAGFQQRLGEAWHRFRAFTAGWLHVVRGRGPGDVERVYRDVLEGRARPADGHVLSMWPQAR